MGYFITEDWFGCGPITEEDIEVLLKFADVLEYSTEPMAEKVFEKIKEKLE